MFNSGDLVRVWSNDLHKSIWGVVIKETEKFVVVDVSYDKGVKISKDKVRLPRIEELATVDKIDWIMARQRRIKLAKQAESELEKERRTR